MNEQRFETLVSAAKRDLPPRVDVTQSVMLRLEELQVERMRRRVWIAASVLSLTAATVMCGMVFPAWEALQDPMTSLMEPIQIVLQAR